MFSYNIPIYRVSELSRNEISPPPSSCLNFKKMSKAEQNAPLQIWMKPSLCDVTKGPPIPKQAYNTLPAEIPFILSASKRAEDPAKHHF